MTSANLEIILQRRHEHHEGGESPLMDNAGRVGRAVALRTQHLAHIWHVCNEVAGRRHLECEDRDDWRAHTAWPLLGATVTTKAAPERHANWKKVDAHVVDTLAGATINAEMGATCALRVV